MRVLVTGGSGFLGSHLCRALHTRGDAVFAVSRVPRPARAGEPSWLRADLADYDALRWAWRAARPDVVFHLTTHGVGSPEIGQVQPTLRNDLIATVNVLEAAAREGCRRLVLAASLDEPTSPRATPATPYAAAKWAATGYARMFYALYGTPVVITRPYMSYGPGQRAHKLVPHVIRALLDGRPPTLSSGRRLVDWIYIDDVVRGLLLAGERPGIEGAELDLGSGELVSVREVVERLMDIIGATAVEFGTIRDRPREIERRADALATFNVLGWRAEVSLDEGLRNTVEWCRAQETELVAGGGEAR